MFNSFLLVSQEGFKFFIISDAGCLIQYREAIGVFNCQKCDCANLSNLFFDKLFAKFSFQSLLGLLLMNSIFLSLPLRGVIMKNVKTEIKRIQFYQAEPYIANCSLVNSSYLVTWIYDQNQSRY